jgi:uncharacterized protein YcbX
MEVGGLEAGKVEVGRVEALWRYPVKSMQGECLPRLAVDAGGVRGDRAYALWDHATSRVASAKNPLLWRTAAWRSAASGGDHPRGRSGKRANAHQRSSHSRQLV